MSVIEIEIDAPLNRGLYVEPLKRRLRGRIDFNRDSEVKAAELARQWQGGIPGDVLGVDTGKKKIYVRNALHHKDHRELADRIERRGQELGEERVEIKDAGEKIPALLRYMRRAVDSGRARLINGQFPEPSKDEPEPRPRTRPRTSTDERLDRVAKRLDELLVGILQFVEERSPKSPAAKGAGDSPAAEEAGEQ